MTLLDPTQEDAEAPKAPKSPKAPRLHKIIATAEFINYKPAHDRYITKQGQGSTIKVACKAAIDAVLSEPKAKAIRNKTPFKVTFQSGD